LQCTVCLLPTSVVHVAVCCDVCCSVFQCVAVCCSLLQPAAMCCVSPPHICIVFGNVLRCVLQCVAVCCRVLRVLQCVAVCSSMLQYVAVCCSVLHVSSLHLQHTVGNATKISVENAPSVCRAFLQKRPSNLCSMHIIHR